jgi:PilZ domain
VKERKGHRPAPSVAQAERRLYPRYNIRIPITIQGETAPDSLHLETSDISRNGCCALAPEPLPVGTRVRVVLQLATPVAVRGCVITRHPDFGNGIMFLAFEGDGETQLRHYLESIRGD